MKVAGAAVELLLIKKKSTPCGIETVGMPPKRSEILAPASTTAAHCLPAFENWMQSYPRVSSWIGKKIGGRDSIYDAVADAGGFMLIDDFLPASIAAGVESLLLRCCCLIVATHHSFSAACHQMLGTAQKQRTTPATTTSSICFKGSPVLCFESTMLISSMPLCFLLAPKAPSLQKLLKLLLASFRAQPKLKLQLLQLPSSYFLLYFAYFPYLIPKISTLSVLPGARVGCSCICLLNLSLQVLQRPLHCAA
jgi:hypothetical protein